MNAVLILGRIDTIDCKAWLHQHATDKRWGTVYAYYV